MTKSPAFVEAPDGYETRVIAQLDASLAQAKGVVAEIEETIAGRNEILRLRYENAELRKLVPPAYRSSSLGPPNHDLIADACQHTAALLRENGFVMSAAIVDSPVFAERLKERL